MRDTVPPAAPAWGTFESEALPHLDRLFRLAMWLERDRSAAEDLVQETLIQALRSFHRYTPGTHGDVASAPRACAAEETPMGAGAMGKDAMGRERATAKMLDPM